MFSSLMLYDSPTFKVSEDLSNFIKSLDFIVICLGSLSLAEIEFSEKTSADTVKNVRRYFIQKNQYR